MAVDEQAGCWSPRPKQSRGSCPQVRRPQSHTKWHRKPTTGRSTYRQVGAFSVLPASRTVSSLSYPTWSIPGDDVLALRNYPLSAGTKGKAEQKVLRPLNPLLRVLQKGQSNENWKPPLENCTPRPFLDSTWRKPHTHLLVSCFVLHLDRQSLIPRGLIILLQLLDAKTRMLFILERIFFLLYGSEKALGNIPLYCMSIISSYKAIIERTQSNIFATALKGEIS